MNSAHNGFHIHDSMSVAWTLSDELDTTIAQDKRVATLARKYVKSKDSASASSFHCFFLAVFSSTGKTILVIFWKNTSAPSHPPVFARVVNLLQGGVPQREDAPFGKLERAA